MEVVLAKAAGSFCSLPPLDPQSRWKTLEFGFKGAMIDAGLTYSIPIKPTYTYSTATKRLRDLRMRYFQGLSSRGSSDITLAITELLEQRKGRLVANRGSYRHGEQGPKLPEVHIFLQLRLFEACCKNFRCLHPARLLVQRKSKVG